MAASPALFKKPHVPVLQQKPTSSKSSYSNLLCKSLIIIFVLLVIPLFPAQAPAFISQSILSKFWELFHLLVIGIAVSYGLFCRKCTKIDVENQSRNDTTHAYLSGVMHVSSFFEDGFENLCISAEKKSMQNWDCLYTKSESMSKSRSSIDDDKKIRSLNFSNGVKDIYEADKENVGQIWNSQYFQGENLVVVADGNYAFDEHKPLGLPVRSLTSRIGDAEKTEFRGPVPINLEKKFDEVAGPSMIPWQSRSGRMEMREEFSNVEPPCHCRNHSGDDFEVENFKSRSFRHPMSAATSEIDSELASEPEDIEESSDDKETEVHVVDDAEVEGSEVDRKADEFIAKFKKQMRLQKIASVKRYSFRA